MNHFIQEHNMKPKELLICGSGASEAVPALFCTCELCREAWKRGGKEIRSRQKTTMPIRFILSQTLLEKHRRRLA